MSAIKLHQWQGSAEWKRYRSQMGNASELAALMDCSPWFPRTPHELWLLKSGRIEQTQTASMRRGLALEPAARTYLEGVFDEVFEPQVVARERISASLDGLSFDGRWVLEIKCPNQGRDSELWRHVQQFAGTARSLLVAGAAGPVLRGRQRRALRGLPCRGRDHRRSHRLRGKAGPGGADGIV